MAKNKISEWSSTPANNTDVGGIDIAEGCAPSGINNALREMMAQVKDMQAGLDGQADAPSCPICLQDLEPRDTLTVTCGHAFHETCVYRWFQEGASTCPVCRHGPLPEAAPFVQSPVRTEAMLWDASLVAVNPLHVPLPDHHLPDDLAAPAASAPPSASPAANPSGLPPPSPPPPVASILSPPQAQTDMSSGMTRRLSTQIRPRDAPSTTQLPSRFLRSRQGTQWHANPTPTTPTSHTQPTRAVATRSVSNRGFVPPAAATRSSQRKRHRLSTHTGGIKSKRSRLSPRAWWIASPSGLVSDASLPTVSPQLPPTIAADPLLAPGSARPRSGRRAASARSASGGSRE